MSALRFFLPLALSVAAFGMAILAALLTPRHSAQTQAAAAEVPQDVDETVAHETPEMEETANVASITRHPRADRNQHLRIVEAILFASAEPVDVAHLKGFLPEGTDIAGLLTDLKRRGLLDDTLVVWGGEFGRTPYAQAGDGRDHNPEGFTVWMAGGGVKSGFTREGAKRLISSSTPSPRFGW